jgi:single-stranded DNA-specific DHH superfamily exonuclease
MALLEALIEDQGLLDHKVLLFLLEPGDIDKNIAGLIANKFMAKYQRPCCILTKVTDGDKISYQGSARGCDKTGVTEFKDICESTGCILFAQGHQGAFGLGLPADKIDEFLAKTDEILKDISDEAIYTVDFTYKGTEVNSEHILDIARYNHFWGKDMDEPLIAVEDLKITKDMFFLMSPDKKPTLKIVLPNKVSILKFNSSQEEYDKLYSETGAVEVNLVGTCNLNDWNGTQYPQLMINDYEIVDKVKYIF